MSELVTQRATAEDLPEIIQLLETNELHPASVEKILEHFFVLKEEEQIIGCGGYEIYGETALLRSVAVKKSIHKKGLGTRIVNDLFKYGETQDLKRIFLLTTTAPDFFIRFGFNQIQRDDVDDAIKTTEEFTSICPTSSVVMRKDLNS